MTEFKLRSPSDKSTQESIDQYTKAVRRKLYVLFGMLLLVIIMMKEARKPENWLWMGFDNAAKVQDTIALNALSGPLSGDEIYDSGLSAGTLENGTLPPDSESPAQANPKSRDLSIAAAEFWESVWKNLPTQDKTALVELIDVSSKPAENRDIVPADFEPLASTLRQSHPTDPQYAEQWEDQIRPALLMVYEEEELNEQQQVTVKRLFQSLDPLILGELEDFTSPGRKSDTPAWFRFWSRILADQETEPATKVSPVQLAAQSEVWRFQRVRIEGRLLAGRKRVAGAHGPLRHNGVWYEWWIGNSHGADEVWCVYTSEKPDSITVSEKFSSFDMKAESVGLFYKVRAYVNADSKGDQCPLILAKNLSVTQKSNPVAEASWTPSTGVMVACVLGMMVLAFVIAMALIRSDKQPVHQPSGEHKAQIENHLGALAEDPNIKSVSERLDELP